VADLMADTFDVDTALLGGRGLWSNLGDWTDAKSYDEACAALARRVGKAAGLGPARDVLDVACGYGGSARLWGAEFGVSAVDATDIRPACVESLRRAAYPGIRHVFISDVSKEIDLPPMVRYDAVVSVDAAYHFASALDLGRLARRCLISGGRLAYTTLVWAGQESEQNSLSRRLFLKAASIPKSAMATPRDLTAKLTDLGFKGVEISILDDEVLLGFARYVGRVSSALSMAQRLRPAWWKIWLTAQACSRLRGWGIQYVLVSAQWS